MKLWELVKDRIRSILSTEFLLCVAVLLLIYVLAMSDKLTVQAASSIAPVITYIVGRTKQKGAQK